MDKKVALAEIEKLEKERSPISKQMEELAENEYVKRYLNLKAKADRIQSELFRAISHLPK